MKKLFFSTVISLLLVVSASAISAEFKLIIDDSDKSSIPEYSRGEFGNTNIDLDGNCINTRNELLKITSLMPTSWSEGGMGCEVIGGLWVDPYSGVYFTNPDSLVLDYTVPLREAWVSGAYTWTLEKRILYANDLTNPDHVLLISRAVGMSKNERGITAWLPGNLYHLSGYLAAWASVKVQWGLTFDSTERDFLVNANKLAIKTMLGFKALDLEKIIDNLK